MSTAAAAEEKLAALARKYRTLIEIHEALAGWNDTRARALDRTLAREFPGALRELQTVPLDELKQRLQALESARDGGPREPWMLPMADYHALFRSAIAGKQRLGRCTGLDDDQAAGLARELGVMAGLTLDAAFVRALLRPPGGRLGPLVLARLAEHYATAASDVEQMLFRKRTRELKLQ